MPEPYILDPFQRIVYLPGSKTFEYRSTACPSGQGGALYERRAITEYADPPRTFIGPWISYGGVCRVNQTPGTGTSPFALYLQPYGTAQFSTSNIAEWNYGETFNEGVNVLVHAELWKIPGLPGSAVGLDGDEKPVIYEVYINNQLYATTTRDVLDFYGANAALTGVYDGPGNTTPVMTLNALRPVPDNTYYPLGTLRAENYSSPTTNNIFNLQQGEVYDFKCVITIPDFNYTAEIYNQMMWV
jgi:hypothetical protein